MKKSVYNWQIPEVSAEHQQLVPILEQLKLPSYFSKLLWNRHLQSEEQIKAFFNPTLELLHDPFALFEMDKAVSRIQAAVENGQRMLIYGDYDADGITSTTVLKEAIELIGGETEFYLPDRFKDGYGPNPQKYQELIEEYELDLIITVDNGVSGHEAIAYANSVGVDVIVTDHHELPESLPEAYAVIHPRHPAGNYPFGDLAGVGVAFKVATALLDDVPMEMLDLVAIGTIADLVSLTGENRALVQLGLDIIKQSDRLGLQALCEKAEIVQNTLTEENIGFGIGPRLNAIGRIGDANPGVTLLSTFDEGEAISLAEMVHTKNSERQRIVKEITVEALEMVAEMPAQGIYVLAKAGWHEGVLGIVASRIVQETGRPALVLGIDLETQIAKGSGRSVEQVNLFTAMSAANEIFTSFGGHHMAAGMSLEASRLTELQGALNEYIVTEGIDFSEGPQLRVEEALEVKDVTVNFIQELALLGPFGTDNPSPVFLFEKSGATDLKQIGAGKNHLKFTLKQHSAELDCIGFDFGFQIGEFSPGEDLAVVGKLGINEWNGNRKPQLFLQDYQVEGFQLFDLRGKKIELNQYSEVSHLIIGFSEQTVKHYQKLTTAPVLLATEALANIANLKGKIKQLVVLDCPVEAQELKTVFQAFDFSRIYLYGISLEECYLNGMPSREQFGKLFGFIKHHQQVDVRYKTKEIANFLKVQESVLIFMIQVFFELGFVTIEGGVMNQVENPTNQPLTASKTYQERELKIKAEEFLLYSSNDDLVQWLLTQEEEN